MARALPVFGGHDAAPRRAAREAVADALTRGIDAAVVVEHVARGLEQMTEAVAAAAPEEPRPACARGCADCCHQRVELTAPEVLALSRHLGALDDDRRAVLAARLDETATALAGLSSRDHHLRQIACALLDADGGCAVHAARPLACRRAHSIDAAACARAAREPAASVVIPHAPALAAHLSALVVGYLEGLAGAGVAPHHYELHAALRIALVLPEAELGAWIEALTPARTREASGLAALLGAARGEGASCAEERGPR
jgi:hypothetical protein